jgi:hypothetical protein
MREVLQQHRRLRQAPGGHARLTAEGMKAIGMDTNTDGYWVTALNDQFTK